MTTIEFDAAFANEDFHGGNLSHTGNRSSAVKLTAGFCGVGTGWLQIIHDMVRDLIKLGWDRDIHQIKEKFGGLRFYIGPHTEEIAARIAEAVEQSYHTCAECGTKEAVKTEAITGWILTLCQTCRAKRTGS